MHLIGLQPRKNSTSRRPETLELGVTIPQKYYLQLARLLNSCIAMRTSRRALAPSSGPRSRRGERDADRETAVRSSDGEREASLYCPSGSVETRESSSALSARSASTFGRVRQCKELEQATAKAAAEGKIGKLYISDYTVICRSCRWSKILAINVLRNAATSYD